MKNVFRGVVALAIGLSVAAGARADDIGRIKVAKGQVSIERASASLPATVGAGLQPADVVVTGNDGSVGITMSDDTLLSAGANSRLSFDQYLHDPSTNQGRFRVSLERGTLAVISGRIAKQSPDAMTVRTPSAILGVRGTEFLVKVGD
jgi:hypothetical protein